MSEYTYTIWAPELRKIEKVKEMLGEDRCDDIYNLGRDPRLFILRRDTPLTDEQIVVIGDLLPFSIIIRETI